MQIQLTSLLSSLCQQYVNRMDVDLNRGLINSIKSNCKAHIFAVDSTDCISYCMPIKFFRRISRTEMTRANRGLNADEE